MYTKQKYLDDSSSADISWRCDLNIIARKHGLSEYSKNRVAFELIKLQKELKTAAKAGLPLKFSHQLLNLDNIDILTYIEFVEKHLGFTVSISAVSYTDNTIIGIS